MRIFRLTLNQRISNQFLVILTVFRNFLKVAFVTTFRVGYMKLVRSSWYYTKIYRLTLNQRILGQFLNFEQEIAFRNVKRVLHILSKFRHNKSIKK